MRRTSQLRPSPDLLLGDWSSSKESCDETCRGILGTPAHSKSNHLRSRARITWRTPWRPLGESIEICPTRGSGASQALCVYRLVQTSSPRFRQNLTSIMDDIWIYGLVDNDATPFNFLFTPQSHYLHSRERNHRLRLLSQNGHSQPGAESKPTFVYDNST